mgnify:FL=1
MAPRVSSYMSSPVIAVRPSDTLAYARNLMLKKDVGRLVVIDEKDALVGVLTVSDLVSAIYEVEFDRPLDQIKVREVMSSNVITIESNKTLKAAAKLMIKNDVGGLPVLGRDGKVVGIITRSDIVRAFSERHSGEFRVGDVMRAEVATARPTHSLFYVIKQMESDPARKVLVVDDQGRLLGVIAERDVALLTLPRSLIEARGKDRYIRRKAIDQLRGKLVTLRNYLIPLAEDVMTSDPITASPDDDLANVAKVMVSERIGCVPVVDNNRKVVGIVTKGDIVQLMSKI